MLSYQHIYHAEDLDLFFMTDAGGEFGDVQLVFAVFQIVQDEGSVVTGESGRPSRNAASVHIDRGSYQRLVAHTDDTGEA